MFKLTAPLFLKTIYNYFKPDFKSAQHRRLEGNIIVFLTETKAKINVSIENKWIDKTIGILDDAQGYLQNGDMDIAWKCFHAAKRMEIFTLDKLALISRAIKIKNESEKKLNSWRKGAIENLLGKAGESIPNEEDLKPETVCHAALIRDEHFNNIAYRDTLFREYLGTLAKLLFAAVTFIVIYFYILDDVSAIKVGYRSTLLGVILFGFFGGTFSAILKIPPKKNESRIPEQVYAFKLSIFRILVGIASAVLIYVFVQTSFFSQLFNFDKSNLNAYMIFVISFAAGFSERLVLRAVSLVTKEKVN